MPCVEPDRDSAAIARRSRKDTARADSSGASGALFWMDPAWWPAGGRRPEPADASDRRGSPAAPPPAAHSGKSRGERRRRRPRPLGGQEVALSWPLVAPCYQHDAIMASAAPQPLPLLMRCSRWDKPYAGRASRAPAASSGRGLPALAPAPCPLRGQATAASSGRPAFPPGQPVRLDRVLTDRLWHACKEVLMARRIRIRRAIDRAREKHRGDSKSPPLGVQEDARAGTPPSAPGACGDLSGALPQPPLDFTARFTRRQMAAFEHLGRASERRGWGALIRWAFAVPQPLPPLRMLALHIAYGVLRIEYQAWRAKMALSMWISRFKTRRGVYTLSYVCDRTREGARR